MEHEFRKISQVAIHRTWRAIERINWVLVLKNYGRYYEILRLVPVLRLVFLKAHPHRLVTV